jgi:hypothetical protein
LDGSFRAVSKHERLALGGAKGIARCAKLDRVATVRLFGKRQSLRGAAEACAGLAFSSLRDREGA